MSSEQIMQLLGVVVAVMLVQAITGLAGSIQDLYSKLLAGGIIYLWSAEKRSTIYDTTTNTGVFNRVQKGSGEASLEAAEPEDFDDDDNDRLVEDDKEKWLQFYRNMGR